MAAFAAALHLSNKLGGRRGLQKNQQPAASQEANKERGLATKRKPVL